MQDREIKSCMYFVLAAFVLLLMVSVSFVLKGKVSILVGFAGLFVLVMASLGLVSGIRDLRKGIRIT